MKKEKENPFPTYFTIPLEELYSRSHTLIVLSFVIMTPLQKVHLKYLWKLLPSTVTQQAGQPTSVGNEITANLLSCLIGTPGLFI